VIGWVRMVGQAVLRWKRYIAFYAEVLKSLGGFLSPYVPEHCRAFDA